MAWYNQHIALQKPLVKTFTQAPYSWGYLFGAFLSDGAKPHYDRHYWYTEIHANDRDFVELVRSFATEVTGYEHKSRFVRHRGWYQLRVTRRAFADVLNVQAKPGSYTWRVPSWIMHGPSSAKRGFLNGFFDGDGWVTGANKHHRPVLGFRSVNLRGLEQIRQLLHTLGIDGRIYKGQAIHSLLVYRFKDAKAYLQVVGITSERKSRLAQDYLGFFEETKRDDYWKPQELSLLRSKFGKLQTSALAKMLNRSPSGVRQKAYALGLIARPVWTVEQLQYLRAHSGDPPSEIAKAIGRTREGVLHMLRRLPVPSTPGSAHMPASTDPSPHP